MRFARSLTALATAGALTLAVAGCGNRDASGTQTLGISITGDQAEPGPEAVTVTVGDPVEITATSDTPQQLHIHGVDEYLDVVPGETASLTVTFDVPGQYEIETHDTGILAAVVEAR